jgi:hypothetical protein
MNFAMLYALPRANEILVYSGDPIGVQAGDVAL